MADKKDDKGAGIREALKDELPDYMINAVKKNNPNLADKFLSMDVPKHTEVIPNLKIEIDEPSIKKKFVSEILFPEAVKSAFTPMPPVPDVSVIPPALFCKWPAMEILPTPPVA